MSLLNKSLNDTFFYFLATAGGKFASFLIIPFINSLLSVEKFGQYDLFLISSSFLLLVIGFGIDSGFAIIITENKKDKKLLGYIFTRSLVASISFLFLLGIVGFIINFYFNISSSNILLLLFLYVLFNYFNYSVFNFIRWIGNAKVASIINFLSSVSGMVFGIIFLYLFERIIENLFLGMVIGNFLGTIISLIIIKEYLIIYDVKNGNKKLMDLFKISLPFVPVYLSNYFSAFSDRFIIITFIGDIYFIGLYALLYRVSQLGSFIVTIISKGFLPVMYDNYNTISGKIFNRRVFNYFNLLLIPTFIFIFFIKNLLINIIGGSNYLEYLNYSKLLPSIFLSTIIFAGMTLNGFGYTIKRKTIKITYISIFGVFLNFILCYFFVSSIGFSFIISSTLFTAILSAIIYTLGSERLYKFGYNFNIMCLIYITLFTVSQILIY